MKKNISPNVAEVSWDVAKNEISKGCKELFSIIENINPSGDLTFIRIRYPFGTYIHCDDELYIPIDDFTSVPLSSDLVPKTLRRLLSYRSIPLGIITANPVEIFREADDKVFSVCISGAQQGIEIGVFEYFGISPCYSVTSGARSLFMVPHINENFKHKRLMKHYGSHITKPNCILKHWNLFSSISHSPFFQTKWYSEILFLTKPWDEALQKNHMDSPAWQNLKKYLYRKGFEHSELGRRKLVMEVLWQNIATKLRKDNAKVDHYTVDTLKHLIYIFLGGISGSRPSIDDYTGPLSEIKRIYVECYGLEQIPTIMAPCRFSLNNNIPVYYSMQNPMIISSSPHKRNSLTIIEEMRNLMLLKNVLSTNFGNIKLNHIKVYEVVKLMNLEFFHSDHTSYGQTFHSSQNLAKLDKDFLHNPTSAQNLSFAGNGSFIKGCIKITKSLAKDVSDEIHWP